MKIYGEQILIRIFVESNKKYKHLVPLYRYFIKNAIKYKLAGLSAVKALIGFLGKDNIIYEDKFFKKSRIMILEIVDTPERLSNFFCNTEELKETFVFSERAYIIAYRTRDEEKKIDTSTVSNVLKDVKESKRNMIEKREKIEKVLMRVFIGDSDRTKEGKDYLYEWLVLEAKKVGADMAIAIKGVSGFGKAGKLRAIETIELSSDMPVIVEIIGDEELITNFIKNIEEHLGDCLITLEKVSQLVLEHKQLFC